MNILIMGATGRRGKLKAQFDVAKDHKVIAVIRDKARDILPGVRYLEGMPTERDLLDKALKGIDAVVVSLNISRKSDNPFAGITAPLTLISDTVTALIPAMEVG